MSVIVRRIKTIKDVVDWGLCTGCGACAYACRDGGISMANVSTVGIRPQFEAGSDAEADLLRLCPGARLDVTPDGRKTTMSEPEREFGQALEIWTGYATDPEVRYKGSSGGVLTALSLYCLEREGMGFVLHTGRAPQLPWQNTTVQSFTRAQLLERAGSRYGPSSPCDSLALIEGSQVPAVFIGKPCDVAAVRAARKQRPALDKNLGVVLTFFCAGTPSTQGTLDLLNELGAEKDSVIDLRYRGEGWPGVFKVSSTGSDDQSEIPYRESWSRLNSYRPLRCHLCPDGLGQTADISCGDDWGRYDVQRPNPGISIILVRTLRGQEILRRAREARYVTLSPATPEDVFAAQPNLLRRRRQIFGRLLALRLLRIPTPTFVGFSLFRGWLMLPPVEKVRSVGGTLRRAIWRSWWKRTYLETSRCETPAGPIA